MFGYIMPLKAELKVREWGDYRAYYCGLCKELKREYGFIPRFLLNYDFVLPAMLADKLYDSTINISQERCMANPFAKRCVCTCSRGLTVAADALILTSFYKLSDNIHDEKGVKRLLAKCVSFFMRNKRAKAAAHMPMLDSVLESETINGHTIEAQGCDSADKAADATSKMTAQLFYSIAPDTHSSKALYRMGLCLGKLIYYLDAAEDYDDDRKDGTYNVFIQMGLNKLEAAREATRLCNMCAGEIALAYNLLDIKADKPLLDNIIFLGIPQSISFAGTKRTKANDKD